MRKTKLFFPGKAGILAFALLAAILVIIIDKSAEGADKYNVGSDQTNSNSKPKKKPKKAVKPTMNKPLRTTVVPGSWGGTDIRLVIEPNATSIEYACADGKITDILAVDQNGNFEAKGFHVRQRPGPMRADDPGTGVPARYTGRISGDQMTLKVTLVENDTLIGDFQLERGKNVRLFKCL
jgi:hypothetical protein